jgi:poly(3-hydroxybutyrate) depolymerase
MNLKSVANELAKRIISVFEKDHEGNRRVFGRDNWFYHQPENEHLILFYEYFHGNDGNGLGASHQTGWTSLVAQLISELNGK